MLHAPMTEFFDDYESEDTRLSYRNDLEQFFQYLVETHPELKELGQITRAHVIQFKNWIKEAGGHGGEIIAPKSLARKLAAITAYFEFLILEQGIIETNPAKSVRRPRPQVQTHTQALTLEQINALIRAIDKNKRAGPLHKAIVVLYFNTGLRRIELLKLKGKHYREAEGLPILEYQSKGGKIAKKALNKTSVEALEAYLVWMKAKGRQIGLEDWLFQPTQNPRDPKNLDRPITPYAVNKIFNKYAKIIGLPFNISPHSARASFITNYLDNGGDIYRVSREVNHSSVRTTQDYDKRHKKLSQSIVFEIDK